MYYLFRSFLVSLLFILFVGCSEKISYSGKVIHYDSFNYTIMTNKNEVLNKIGQPNFIDPIEKKYYYFSEKKNVKNFFEKKIENRIMLVFEFDENDTIKSITKFDLSDQKSINFIKDTTSHELIQRGLIEKIFGGVGSSVPSTTE